MRLRDGSHLLKWQHYIWAAGVIWTLAVILMLSVSVVFDQQHILESAVSNARSLAERDRHWVVSMSERLYMTSGEPRYTPDTDPRMPQDTVVTQSGERLTRVSPVSLLRRLNEIRVGSNTVVLRLVSLKPVRPANTADVWESQALQQLERGKAEVTTVDEQTGEPLLRFVSPLRIESTCLACHRWQGYAEGDIRGGVSVTLPLTPYTGLAEEHLLADVSGHGILWLLGIAGLFVASQHLGRRIAERNAAIDENIRREVLFRQIWTQSLDGMRLVDADGNIILVNDAYCRLVGRAREDLQGHPASAAYAPDIAGEVQAMIRSQFDVSNFQAQLLLDLPSHDGALLSLERRNSLLEIPGEPAKLLSIFRNLDERRKAEAALRESEERYSRIVTTPLVGIWELDASGRTSYANARMAEMLGYTVPEMLGMSMYDFMDVTTREQARMNLQRRAQRIDEQHEFRFLRKDGTMVDTLISTKSIHRDDGVFLGALGILVNIDALKKAEQALRTSESRYRTLFETNLAGVYRMTGKGTILECNDSFALMLGYNAATELVGTSTERLFFRKDDRDAFLLRVSTRGTLRADEILLRRKDGGEMWGLEDVTLLEDGTVFGTMIDITRLKQYQTSLAESEERLRLLIESTDDIVLMQDLDGRFLYVNPSSRYGVGWEEILGRKPEDILDRETAERSMALLQEVVQTGTPSEHIELVPWQGKNLWFAAKRHPVFDKEGKIRAISMFSRNITLQKEAEEELRRSEERLKMETLRTQISADLHDELGSTLSSTAIFSTMLRQELGDGNQRASEVLDRIQNNLQAAQESLHDIVWAINPDNEPLEQTLYRIREYATEMLEPHRIRLRLEIPETLSRPSFPMTARRDLYLIFKEAINNVAKHARCSEVDLQVHEDGFFLEVALADNGRGIDLSPRPRGNGLANMRHRAARMGGVLTIDSTPGKGTVVTLLTPIA